MKRLSGWNKKTILSREELSSLIESTNVEYTTNFKLP